MGMHWKHPLMKDGWKVQVQFTNQGVEYRVLDFDGKSVSFFPDTPYPAENIKRAIKRAVRAGLKKEQEPQ